MALLGRLIGGIIALVVVVVIFMMLGNLFEDIIKELDSLDVHSSDLYSVDVDGQKRYELDILVEDIASYEEDDYPWGDVRVTVTAADGTELVPDTAPVPDDGTPSLTPRVTYVSRSNNTGYIGTGDSIMVRGLDGTFEGARVRVHIGDNNLHTVSLSSDFTDRGTLTPTDPSIVSRGLEDVAAWSAVLAVSDLSPHDAMFRWSNVHVQVEDVGGDVLLPMTPLRRFEGASAIDDDEDGAVDVEAWFMDMTEELGLSPTHPAMPFPELFVKEGDGIAITGIDRSFEGAIVRIYEGQDRVGYSAPLPSFPRVDVSVVLDDVRVSRFVIDHVGYAKVGWNVTEVGPAREVVDWEDVLVVVMDPSGTSELLNATPVVDPVSYDGTAGAYFQEYGLTERTMDVGDRVVLSCLDESYHGAVLMLMWGNQTIATAEVPDGYNLSTEVTLSLGTPSVSASNINGTFYFKAAVDVYNTITNLVVPLWTDLSLAIVNDVGTYLLVATAPSPDGGVYDVDDTDGIDTEAWYVETTTGDDECGPGDVLVVTGMPETCEDARLQVLLGGEVIGEVRLPSEFVY